ncbi:tetratricopeptide repeat protein [Ligilactobacillus sp. WILCCON 0076]|uniref:Tetratricopeptide repeat protein n=1 Tax=Ligilactobacillus ubinensis TaxID=2876789 RepID=A0A9X2JLL4_9LACO|nr:tetratricopeptide repeat protein [Ligilactobacillus ubinensis]MCP0887039.1 tetratricopeptide repeat protein [Ligilactobacillus ubinensis]
MFGFNKKKKVESIDNKKLTPETIDVLTVKLSELQKKLDMTDDEDEKIKVYEELGAVYIKLNKTDEAIVAYETSIKIKEQFGKAYNALLNLYEEKRKAAALTKDDTEIQKWIRKTDNLLDMSKRVLRKNMF